MKKTGKKAVGNDARKKKPKSKVARKLSPSKAKAAAPQKARKEKTAAVEIRAREQGYYVVDTLVGLPTERKAPAGLQSGDLQGLSHDDVADSQTVDELLEEGNAFEAGVVEGVEDSRKAGTRAVRTRQVPVDDVPREYLDED